MVEAAGIEPASAVYPTERTTCLVCFEVLTVKAQQTGPVDRCTIPLIVHPPVEWESGGEPLLPLPRIRPSQGKGIGRGAPQSAGHDGYVRPP